MNMTIKELNEIENFEATIEMKNGRAIVKMNKRPEETNRW